MRERFLKKLAHWHTSAPGRMLLLVILLTFIFIGFASQLKVTLRWSDLLPTDDPRTIQFNKIIDEFVSSTSIIIVVQGEKQRMTQFADELAPRLLAARDTSKNTMIIREISSKEAKIEGLRAENSSEAAIPKIEGEIAALREQMNFKIIRRVDYKTEIRFPSKNHGLMLIKENDLKNMKDIFMDPNLTGILYNLNQSMEKEYVGQSESISTREKEDQAVVFLSGIRNLVQLMQSDTRPEKRSPMLTRMTRLTSCCWANRT